MTSLSIAFAPELPWALVVALAIAGAVLVVFGLWQRLRGSSVRLLAWAILTCALFNPSILVEEREPLKSVVAVIVDRSGSQKLADRAAQTDALRAAVLERLKGLGRFDVREAEVGDELSRNTDVSTALFKGMASALRDVPPEQIGGAILITDGQVHDIPEQLGAAGIHWPVHAMITGSAADRDRRVSIVEAPRIQPGWGTGRNLLPDRPIQHRRPRAGRCRHASRRAGNWRAKRRARRGAEISVRIAAWRPQHSRD